MQLFVIPQPTLGAGGGQSTATSTVKTNNNISNNSNSIIFSGQRADSSSFKLAELHGDHLLLGSLNVVHNISVATLREVRRIDWPPTPEDNRLCQVKGKSASQCQNYIRLLKLDSAQVLFVCGTNAYRPLCRRYQMAKSNNSNSYELLSESLGDGRCPHQETQNATGLFVGDQLYSATSATFSGSDALIYRDPLRTEQFNSRHLNCEYQLEI